MQSLYDKFCVLKPSDGVDESRKVEIEEIKKNNESKRECRYMIRTFLPAGQENFAVEKFEDGQVGVFDCSATNTSIVQRLIYDTFEKNENIFAVFISNLDSDHINGLEYLISCCAAKKKFAPFLDNGGALLAAIEEAAFRGKELSDLCCGFSATQKAQ